MQFNNSGNCYDCAALAVLSGRFSLKYLADILFSVLTLNTHKHWSAPIMVVLYCPKPFVVKSICKYWLQNLKNHFFVGWFSFRAWDLFWVSSCWDFLQMWSIMFGKASETYIVIFSLIFKGTLPERPVYVNLNAQCWKSFVHTTA